MVLEVVVYEIVSTAAGFLGIKMIKLGHTKKRLQSINAPKQLPIIDKYLKNKVGTVTKTQQFLVNRIVNLISTVIKYQAFRYLIVLFMRRSHANQLEEGSDQRSSIRITRGTRSPRLLLRGEEDKAA